MYFCVNYHVVISSILLIIEGRCYIMYKYDFKTYDRALESINDVIWEINVTSNEFFLDDRILKITGYTPDNFTSIQNFIEKLSLEKDKIPALVDFDNYICSRSHFYQSSFRIKTKNSEIKWILIKGKIFNDSNSNSTLISGSISDITEIKKLQSEISYVSNYDSLTGLPNRTFFFSMLNNSLIHAKIENIKLALLFIDLDNFKSINDTNGHNYGDHLLRVFSQLITSLFSEHGKVARIGGDEFVLLIHDFKTMDEIQNICNIIQHYLVSPFEILDKWIYVTASIGIATFPYDSSSPSELVNFADFAMFQSKLKGKNNYTFFRKDISDFYLRQSQIENELKNSITNKEFSIFYQPQINSNNNKITGVEALIRWKNARLGNIPPSEFIPIAEKNGFIVKLGDWILNKVLSDVCIWQQQKFNFGTVSINISPIQIKESNFKEDLINTCTKYNISPNLLEIEITEGTLIEIYDDKIDTLNDIIKSGIHLAIDDFGTGYSSLNYLTNLPVNTLKIDKSFIDNIKNDKNKAVIKSIVFLSNALNYKIVTEGVETKEQLDLLRDLGCHIIQGYYFSKPLPQSEFMKMLNKSKDWSEYFG